jgi:hypothetical protein
MTSSVAIYCGKRPDECKAAQNLLRIRAIQLGRRPRYNHRFKMCRVINSSTFLSQARAFLFFTFGASTPCQYWHSSATMVFFPVCLVTNIRYLCHCPRSRYNLMQKFRLSGFLAARLIHRDRVIQGVRKAAHGDGFDPAGQGISPPHRFRDQAAFESEFGRFAESRR